MKTLVLFSALLVAAPLCNAATVLIDFGTTPTTGWNTFYNTTVTDLKTSTSVSTGYNLAVSSPTPVLNSFADNPAPINSYAPFTPSSVTNDFIFTTALTTFTLSGLDPALTYDFTFFSYINRDTSRASRFTIAGYTPVNIQPSGNVTNTNLGGGTGTITGVLPNALGEIQFTAASTASNNWVLSGLQITYVPEPSSTLLGLLPLGFFLSRRKRQEALI